MKNEKFGLFENIIVDNHTKIVLENISYMKKLEEIFL